MQPEVIWSAKGILASGCIALTLMVVIERKEQVFERF
jgi:hypothetical protein